MTSKNIPEGLPMVFLANHSHLLVSFNASDSKENMCCQIGDRRQLLVTAVDGILGDMNVSRSRKVAELHNKQTRVLCVCGCDRYRITEGDGRISYQVSFYLLCPRRQLDLQGIMKIEAA